MNWYYKLLKWLLELNVHQGRQIKRRLASFFAKAWTRSKPSKHSFRTTKDFHRSATKHPDGDRCEQHQIWLFWQLWTWSFPHHPDLLLSNPVTLDALSTPRSKILKTLKRLNMKREKIWKSDETAVAPRGSCSIKI